ncbi:MAG: hypothetical protein K9G58_10890 [Bacteroidales bacterium]|nr:hypothetical protein [Bacteroidales bacterium]MCF8386834.1 hypothetical protein [Bacteroidales bacterium]MCF8398669.1 hypothetical protein [Bacteroidales bacterium]
MNKWATLFLIFFSCGIYAQEIKYESFNDLSKNIILQGFFNYSSDYYFIFIPVVTDDWSFFYYGSYNTRSSTSFIKDDYFLKNDYFGNARKLFKKEIFESVEMELFPELPDKDSLMTIKVLNKDERMFDLIYHPTHADSFSLVKVHPDKTVTKTWKFNDDEIYEIDIQQGTEYMKVFNLYKKDTLFQTQYIDTRKARFYRIDYNYNKKGLKNKTYFKGRVGQNKLKLYRYFDYIYLNGLLSVYHKKKRSGRILETIKYYYNSQGQLTGTTKINNTEAPNWNLKYDYENGQLTEKNIYQGPEHVFRIQYLYTSNGEIDKIIFDELKSNIQKIASFDYNLMKRIYGISITRKKGGFTSKFQSELALNYNKKGNIDVIYELDKSGRIINEVDFVYYPEPIPSTNAK